MLENDIKTCNRKQTKWYWWWSSPINLNMQKTQQSKLELNSYNLKLPIRNIFDVKWSFKIEDNNKVASPLDCLKNNFFVSYEQTYDSIYWYCTTSYQIPINWKNAINWNCGTTNKKYNFNKTFNQLYKEKTEKLYIDWTEVIYENNWNNFNQNQQNTNNNQKKKSYYFK